jgi:hypothetical protein
LAKYVRYQLLSARTVTLLSVITILVVFALAFLLGHRSLLVEVERSVGILSIGLFLFLSHFLYRGVRVKNEPLVRERWKPIQGSDFTDVMSNLPDVTPSFELVGEGLGGIILSILSWIVFIIVIFLLLYVLANMVWGIIFVLAVIVYWIFYRALRLAFIKSRSCKGKVLFSLGYGLMYTIMYMSWVYGALLGFKVLFR